MKVFFSERQKQLIELLRGGTTIPGGNIASYLGVTTRTIRTDIRKINELSGNSLISGNWNGYSLDQNQLKSLYPGTIFLDKNQLHQQILQKLILTDHEINIYDLANELFISPSTLHFYLREISKQLEEQYLRLDINNSKIFLNGSELNRRRMITKLIFNDINDMFFSLDKVAMLFDNLDIYIVKDIILNSMQKFNLQASDVYKQNLIINISITFNRILNGFSIDKTPVNNYNNEKTVEYLAACYIVEKFRKKYPVLVSERDIFYISLLILGQTKRYLTDSSFKQVEGLLSEDFISKIREILFYTFNYFMLKTNYDDFFLNFALHINFLIIRSSIGNSVANPLAENIKCKYPFIYEIAVFIAHSIENTFSIEVDDYEIGFLALHIGAALITSSKKESEKIKVIMVGSECHGLTSGIAQKIQEKYLERIEIVDTIPYLKQDSIQGDSLLYVSMLPDNSMLNNVISISPFLTDDDYLKLDYAIDQSFRLRNKRLMKQLIASFFREELFFHNMIFSDKYEIIRFLGEKTVQFGIAKGGFVESVIKREDLSSTCFFDAFAVPHAIELNAYQTSFSILTTEDFLPWDDKRIKVIFMIAVSKEDRKEFEKIYHCIIDILCDKQSLLRVSEAKTYMDFINCINEMI